MADTFTFNIGNTHKEVKEGAKGAASTRLSLPLYICSFFLVNEKSPVDIVPSRGCSVQSEGGDRVRVHGDCYIDGRALCWHAGMLACWHAGARHAITPLIIYI